MAWLVALGVLLSLATPAEASHKAPYVIRDTDGDLWFDWIEALLGKSRYDSESDPVDVDGNCVVRSVDTDLIPQPDPNEPALPHGPDNDTSPPESAGACTVPESPVAPDDAPVLNETDPNDLPVPDEADPGDLPGLNDTELPGIPTAPELPAPNLGGPCDIEGWPGCPRDREYPDGSNDEQKDDYQHQSTSPQPDGGGAGEDPETPGGETPDPANGTADALNETATDTAGPLIQQVRSFLNETTGLVDITWILGDGQEESDADRYEIYRNDSSTPVGGTSHQGNQTSFETQDRSHPEGNVTYTVVPVYETTNGTVEGNGTSSDPAEYQRFPKQTANELRKCGPDARDSDLDAICDVAEEALGTNPFALDSDADGIPDPLALRLGLVGPWADPPEDDDTDARSDATTTSASGEPVAQTPLIVHAVLGMGATLTASALGTIVHFRRP